MFRKSIHQQGAGLFFRDAPGLKVEKGFFVELADRAAVGAFNVIGENLELRLGVDRGLITDQNIVVLLKGIRFLGDFIDYDLTVEDAGGVLPVNALIILMALTIGLPMVYQSVVVYVLFVSPKWSLPSW